MSLFHVEHCLYCDEVMEPQLTWSTIFLGPTKSWLCRRCEERLMLINEPICQICGRPFSNMPVEFIQADLCHDCVRWESSEKWSHVLSKNYSLYVYNDFLSEVIARFKFRGDYELVKVFSEKLKTLFEQIDHDLIVPIPLSDKRLYERGFNQAEALIKEADREPIHLLSRVHAEKQSKKSREERIHLDQVFQYTNSTEVSIKNKTILLVDDIYTTGSTLRHAALLLKEAGARQIFSLTIARG